MPLPLDSINHLAREVADVDRSVNFYEQVLGFRPIRRPAFHFRGAWLFGYGVQLHIIEGKVSPPGPAISPRADHVAFHTSDIEGVESALRGLKINYLRNVQGPTGLIQLFFHDPDGNHIEVASYPVHPDVAGTS
jgi:catechol 2,3-dioxygenase-like lactoylglutathione lyase family enzyme